MYGIPRRKRNGRRRTASEKNKGIQPKTINEESHTT